MLSIREFLIDSWFPYGEVGVEGLRERAVSSALPPIYFLHVWFARRPLVASRTTVLCSILRTDNKEKIFKILGFPTDKDIVLIQKDAEISKASGIRKNQSPYTWDRAFKHVPTKSELEWLHDKLKQIWNGKLPTVLDPMAGGGSIPFESMRLGLPTVASDLNPVAFLILKATLEYPAKFREKLIPAIKEFCSEVHEKAYSELNPFFPNVEDEKIYQYLWCRTIVCNKCGLLIPLSPNWWVVKSDEEEDQIAIKLKIPKESEGNTCSFEIIKNPQKIGYDPDNGTDVGKDGRCPRCPRTISGDVIKKDAQEGNMGHQLYCVSTKKIIGLKKQERYFRLPTDTEIASVISAEQRLQEKLPKWIKNKLVPETIIQHGMKTREPLNFGMKTWIDMFNPRQLLVHMTYLEKFLEVKTKWSNDKTKDKMFVEALTVYGAMVFDTCINFNCILTRWSSSRLRVLGAMDMQAYPFKTSYSEWNQIGPGRSESGFLWSLSKTMKATKNLVDLLPSTSHDLKLCSADASNLKLADGSIDAIIVDPPYGENVMYGEMSDFFYVWLKKMVGDLFQFEFTKELSDKDSEAVANLSLYRDAGRGQAKKLADQHYQSKMEACFKEMNRVLTNDGVLTVMFTHRRSEAWSGLTKALMNAGFTFKSSWAIVTEPGQKFGKSGGNLKRTVILACKKRTEEKKGLWSNVKEELYREAETKVKEYADSGITGPDLLVCTYGPVLGKFGNYSLIKDSSGNTKGPEDALELVAEAVNKFTVDIPGADLETLAYVNLITSFPQQIIDEDDARITVVFGGNLSIHDLIDKGLVSKSGKKITILTSKQRLENGIIDLAKPDALKSLIDVVHASLITFEKLGTKAVKKLLEDTGKDSSDSGLIATLKSISSLGFDMSGKSAISAEVRVATSLLQALGYEPESVLKKGEKLTHYTKFKKGEKLDDYEESSDEDQ